MSLKPYLIICCTNYTRRVWRYVNPDNYSWEVNRIIGFLDKLLFIRLATTETIAFSINLQCCMMCTILDDSEKYVMFKYHKKRIYQIIYLRFIATTKHILYTLLAQYFEEACIVATVIVSRLPMLTTGVNEHFPLENSTNTLAQLLACAPRCM